MFELVLALRVNDVSAILQSELNERSLHDMEARIDAYDSKNREQFNELQKDIFELKSKYQQRFAKSSNHVSCA